MSARPLSIDGPFYDELEAGQILPSQPAVTIGQRHSGAVPVDHGRAAAVVRSTDRLSAGGDRRARRLPGRAPASPCEPLGRTEHRRRRGRVIANPFVSRRSASIDRSTSGHPAAPSSDGEGPRRCLRRGLIGTPGQGAARHHPPRSTTTSWRPTSAAPSCRRGDRLPGRPLPAADDALCSTATWRRCRQVGLRERMPPSAPWPVGSVWPTRRPHRDGRRPRAPHPQPGHGPSGSGRLARPRHGGHVIGLPRRRSAGSADGLATVIGWHSCITWRRRSKAGTCWSSPTKAVVEQPLDGGAAPRAFDVVASRGGDRAGRLLSWAPIVLVGPPQCRQDAADTVPVYRRGHHGRRLRHRRGDRPTARGSGRQGGVGRAAGRSRSRPSPRSWAIRRSRS